MVVGGGFRKEGRRRKLVALLSREGWWIGRFAEEATEASEQKAGAALASAQASGVAEGTGVAAGGKATEVIGDVAVVEVDLGKGRVAFGDGIALPSRNKPVTYLGEEVGNKKIEPHKKAEKSKDQPQGQHSGSRRKSKRNRKKKWQGLTSSASST